jgi:hypothetical protein
MIAVKPEYTFYPTMLDELLSTAGDRVYAALCRLYWPD